MIIWLTGLACSGKTTIGKRVHALARDEAPNTVMVDGDEVRRLFNLEGDHLYTIEGRRMVAGRIHDLCVWCDRQGINVVCCTISLFDDLHRMNREVFSRYFEVFIDVPMEVLKKRDDKNLYGPALRGETKNVMGVDLPFAPPADPDMVVDNGADGIDLGAVAADILERARAS